MASAPLLDVVVYHCQQATEKTLKGFLFWHDTMFRKTHDLVELLNQCVAHDQTLIELSSTAQILTPFAHTFRYPGSLLEPPLEDAQDALARAAAAYQVVVKCLPMEVSAFEIQT
ncbi:MAG: HEPN domain-containing protein [Roseiflexaceae bacterium]|nr:HEPN domain-containing protein [Roseiflexaceae bacterium]